MIEDLRNRMLVHEKELGKYASRDKEAIRLKKEIKDIRPEYYRDIDRIIWSKSYFRYMDKTQVFTIKDNDHISRRMSHVQMVSKIARTIGKYLDEEIIHKSKTKELKENYKFATKESSLEGNNNYKHVNTNNFINGRRNSRQSIICKRKEDEKI